METKTVLHDQGLPLEKRKVMVFTTCSRIPPHLERFMTSIACFIPVQALRYC